MKIREFEKSVIKLFGNIDYARISEFLDVKQDHLEYLFNSPIKTKISSRLAFKISKMFNIPLHPEYTYYWSNITKEEFRSWNYAFERQWQFYKVWGNLLYNDQTSDAYFIEALEDKFDLDDATELQKAWKLASQNANRFASFYRGEWDATLYTEGMTSVGGKFIQVDEMIGHPVLDSSYVNIKDFVAGRFEKDQITPEVLATKMEKDSKKAKKIAANYSSQSPDKQNLLIELNDIDAWAYFGMYVAETIRGGIAIHNYRNGKDKRDQQEAVEHLEKALTYWESYTLTMETYNVLEMPYQFDQHFSWRKHIEDAENDIRIAKE